MSDVDFVAEYESVEREFPRRAPVDAAKAAPSAPIAARPIAPTNPRSESLPLPLDFRTLAAKQPPERDWAIERWLGMGHVTLLAGVGGIGKTLLAQMMASAVAIERDFIRDSRSGEPRPFGRK